MSEHKHHTIVLRHSIREDITDVHDSYRQLLTSEGEELAIKYGQVLSQYSDIFNLYYSPVPRCEQTCYFINKGLERMKKVTHEPSRLDFLGGFYILDHKKFANFCNSLGGWNYIEKWYNNEDLDSSVVRFTDASNMFYEHLINMKKNDGINICITHDWNILLLQGRGKNSFAEIKYPDYLEGFSFNEKGELKQVVQKDFLANGLD